MSVRHITVRGKYEYGSFFVVESQARRPNGTTQYMCELTCNTTFGVVGHFWCSMGRPAAEFLRGAGKDYVLGKLWGLQAEVYDETAAVGSMRRHLLKARRGGQLDAVSARSMWNEVGEMGLSTEHHLIQYVHLDSYWEEVFANGEINYKARNPQAEGFWGFLWDGFLEQLEAENA